jgi:hypothetical protein
MNTNNYYKYKKYKSKYLELKLFVNKVENNDKTITLRIIKPFKTTGLNADARIFKNAIDKIKDVNVVISTEDEVLKNKPNDDIHLYISNTKKEVLRYCKKKILMINHELFNQNEEELEVLREIDIIISRTEIGYNFAEEIKKKNNLKYEIRLIKFTSDFPVIKIEKDYTRILHSAGEHHWKQTDSIIKCWKKYNDFPEIIITCTDQCYRNIMKLLKDIPNNVKIYNKLIPYNEYIELKNKIGYHLCPSIVEGYGHYLNEARKVKSLVITSNMAPMNELINKQSGILLNCDEIGKKKNGVDLCIINEDTMYKGIKEALSIIQNDRDKMIEEAYNNFVKDSNYFEEIIIKIINENLTKK